MIKSSVEQSKPLLPAAELAQRSTNYYSSSFARPEHADGSGELYEIYLQHAIKNVLQI